MKKFLLLILSAVCLVSCSVDPVEKEPTDSQISTLNATYQVNGCSVTRFNFSEAGSIEVRNDLEFIYVKIVANGDYTLFQLNLHFATSLDGFPTTGNGSLQTNKMDYQTSFKSGINEYTYKFPLNSFGDSFLVAAYSEFQLGKKKHSFYAGDLTNSQFNYFQYHLFNHPNAGADHTKTISLNAAIALPSWDEVRKTYTSMLDPGVPQGQFIGSFEPSISDIIKRFNDPLLGGAGEYPTVYTIGEGNCKDSVNLTLIVADDSV